MMAGINTEELLQRLDEQHQAYLATFRLVHEALLQTATGNTPQNLVVAPIKRRRRSTLDVDAERPLFARPSTYRSSILTAESDESEDDDELYVETPLSTYKFDLEDLRQHLKTYEFNEFGKTLLNDVVYNNRLHYPALFPDYSLDEKWHNSHYSVFDVGRDGVPHSRHKVVKEGTASIDSAIWQAIQDLNANPTTQRPAVGRITIVREPSPIVFGALHLTMNQNFDMDEVFQHLVEESDSSAHMLNRPFSREPRQQRSFIFKLDFYTIVGEGIQPQPWQRTDSTGGSGDRSKDHLQISRCSSIVALSLSGPHVKTLSTAARREKAQDGLVYDPWAPWHVLNIQCYPDHKHSMDSHDSTKHYVNGPEAFLHTLLVEFKDAEKRYEAIYANITKLVTPQAQFMFDGKLRDDLLFEDAKFTYSRRYFWAFQTLGLMNNGIKAIVDAYEDTFTDEVWEGKHKSLWPMIDEDSHRNQYWRKRMMNLKRDFERQIKNLGKLYAENDDRRKEIRTLRDQLFSGTSVLESRKSVELSEVTILQGHNIKLLTLVSIFFLPLTFVTSVFGMTNMPTEHQFKAFGITLGTVCIPFFFLIGSLNTTAGMKFWSDKWHRFLHWMFGRAVPSEESNGGRNARNASFSKPRRSLSSTEARDARRIRESQIKPITRKRTIAPLNASLQDSSLESSSKDINMSTIRLHESTSLATPPPMPETAPESETEHRLSWWKRLTRRINADPDDLREEHV